MRWAPSGNNGTKFILYHFFFFLNIYFVAPKVFTDILHCINKNTLERKLLEFKEFCKRPVTFFFYALLLLSKIISHSHNSSTLFICKVYIVVYQDEFNLEVPRFNGQFKELIVTCSQFEREKRLNFVQVT